MDVVFILVAPSRPANVGAVARAMKTQGFAQLRIVASEAHLDEEAHWVAHGAQELLAEATHYESAEQALSDCDLVVATTARRRGCVRDYWEPQQVQQQLAAKSEQLGRVAILFGCEESGLPNELIDQADLLSCIPLAQPQPSLNLAQAAMVYAFALAPLASLSNTAELDSVDLSRSSTAEDPQEQGQWLALKQRLAQLQNRLGNDDDAKLSEWLQDRLGLIEGRDIRMLHTLLSNIESALNKP
ncbi:tRNA/rRNA methyltransferase [Corallincola platygyrae]|uniref:tRNA (cytidine/uridine-2'-O-)-methyltransferase TrmJ n=1 Tax=Corallincola platygyrae TaxID=1193278 RepID=A0ABW4XNZ0_9GAMM